jgi:hypothetical protein
VRGNQLPAVVLMRGGCIRRVLGGRGARCSREVEVIETLREMAA